MRPAVQFKVNGGCVAAFRMPIDRSPTKGKHETLSNQDQNVRRVCLGVHPMYEAGTEAAVLRFGQRQVNHSTVVVRCVVAASLGGAPPDLAKLSPV